MDVAVYVVWSPQLGARAKHVASASALVADARARHYWDGDMRLGRAYQPVLGLTQPAWDVWMLFDRDAMWRDGQVPDPAWWEHQLPDGPSARHLEPNRFAAHARALEAAADRGQR